MRSFSLLACLFFVHSAFAQIPPPPDPEEVLSDAYTGKSYSPYACLLYTSDAADD